MTKYVRKSATINLSRGYGAGGRSAGGRATTALGGELNKRSKQTVGIGLREWLFSINAFFLLRLKHIVGKSPISIWISAREIV
jgi:hypothetical protein